MTHTYHKTSTVNTFAQISLAFNDASVHHVFAAILLSLDVTCRGRLEDLRSMWPFQASKCQQFQTGARYQELGPTGSVQYVRNRQDLRLCRYLWPVARPRGIVFCIHGFGDDTGSLLLKRSKPQHKGKYAKSTVALLNKRGYSVACMDLQGCGRSEGYKNRRGYFRHFSDLVTDFIDFVDDIRGQLQGFPDSIPSFVFGASLGGCLAVHAVQHCPNVFAGVVLLAPMLSVDGIRRSGLNRLRNTFAGVLNLLAPELPLPTVAPRGDIKHDIQPGCMPHRPRSNGCIRVRVGYQCVKAIQWARDNAHRISFPYLIIHGSADTVCDPQVGTDRTPPGGSISGVAWPVGIEGILSRLGI